MDFIMTIGLPGCGKSTYAAKTGAIICSSDQVREDFHLTDNAKVFTEVNRQVRNAFKSGHDVVYDATNLSRKRRMNYLKTISDFDVKKKAVCFATPLSICKAQNLMRDEKRIVPDSVYDKFIRCFQIPAMYEGWDEIEFRFDSRPFDPVFTFEKADAFNQNNSHHNLTLGSHLRMAEQYAIDHGYSHLTSACRYHDIGKLVTKAFLDSKGQVTEDAHYFGHDNASAYLYLSEIATNTENDLYTANLINWHMMPFNWDQDPRAKEKARKLIGDNMMDDIDKIHQADTSSKGE